MSRCILAVSAHPDDETLGCGGTLLKHRDAGDEVHWLIVTTSWSPMFDEDFIARRKSQIVAVAAAFGMASVHEIGLKAARLDVMALGEVIDPVRAAIDTVTSDRIYVVHRGDVHDDHRVTFEAVWAATKPFNVGNACEIFAYETISSTNMAPPMQENAFLPNSWCDISDHLQRKIEIFGIYESELRVPPHPRSEQAIEALARLRGGSIGVDFAEAFMIMRQVW